MAKVTPKKSVVRVATKNNIFPERRRAGFTFTPNARVVELDEEQLRLIKADDALVIFDMGGDDTDASLKRELAAAAAKIAELELELERTNDNLDRAVAVLEKNGLTVEVDREPSERPTQTDKAETGGEDFGSGAAIPSLDHTRTPVKPGQRGG